MIDYRLYLVTSGTDRHTVDVAAKAAAAGAGVVQVRAKQLTTRALLELVTNVSDAVLRANSATRVVVDDSVEVTWAAMRNGSHVHGVHLGQDDLPVACARTMLGSEAIIGLTTGTLELVQAAQQQADLIDYLGCGPFRPTPTKDSGRVPLGVAGYVPITAATTLPVVAIGDIKVPDVAKLAATGVAGVAMVRTIMTAVDPGQVVREILTQWDLSTSA